MTRANYERRMLAYVFDVFFSFVFAVFFNLFAKKVLKIAFPLWLDVTYVLTCLSYFFYVSLTYYFFDGVTLGGLIFNVRIVNMDNSRLTFKTSLMRAILLAVIFISLYNIIYMLLHKTQVSFYDDATNTKAVERKHIEEYL